MIASFTVPAGAVNYWLLLVVAIAGVLFLTKALGALLSTRVLKDLGRLQSEEGQIVLGAAVIDDVIGLAILAVIMSLVADETLTMESLIRTALIPAAFLTGLMLDAGGQNSRVEGATRWLTALLVPFFFAFTGALVNLRAIGNGHALAMGAALVGCGVIGKVAAGWAAVGSRADKLLIGVAMVPRGEMGLIFAQAGLAAGAIDQGLFGAIIVMVLVTTMLTPPTLVAIARRAPRVSPA